ncbi:MAG: cytochrome c maturation protein CcmE [Sediminibacterium sp.]|nr:cytochrome c maturation protein CcmE [Sediminibacterium sp.]
MKNFQIILIILVLVTICYFVSTEGSLSSYQTIATAKKNPNVFINIIARMDTTKPVIYLPEKDPNLFEFYIVDSLGAEAKVLYHNPKPTDIEKANRLVLKGTYKDNYFDCQEILIKCPSKYKDQQVTQPDKINM